ncbi:MAG: hypothetical protein ACMUJM_18600 [bacterium]
MNQLLRGKYRDIITTAKGTVQWKSGWRSNLIVDKCSVLLAALMKQDEAMGGILYWAVGEGQKEWDLQAPAPSLTISQLTKEVYRQSINVAQIIYIDQNEQPSQTATDRLEVTMEISGEDIISDGFQSLREFGLFGGDATVNPNSGLMIDYVIHPRIDLTSSTRLLRTVQLTFTTGIPEQ